jgi:hypothetical protein
MKTCNNRSSRLGPAAGLSLDGLRERGGGDYVGKLGPGGIGP